MNVALVCPDDLSTVLFCKGLVRTLKQHNGIRICIISGYTEEFEDYTKDIKSWDVEHFNVPMYRFVSLRRDIRYLLALRKLYKNKNIDIAVHWTTKPNIYGPIAAKIAGVDGVIIAIRGLGSVFLRETTIKGNLLKYMAKKLYKVSCSLGNVVWFTNENDLRYFVENGIVDKDKLILTKNAVDVDYYSVRSIREESILSLKDELNIKESDKVVVMVARMIWPKGIKEYFEAAEILASKYSNIKLILVAPLEEGSEYAVPEGYIKEWQGRCRNLLWLGFRKDVRELYALSDIAVLPSYYKEGGYPRALLEPMAMGKPVITTDMPDCRGPVEEGKNGYLVPPKDSRSLASAIENIIFDDQKCKDFGTYSRRKIEIEFDEKIVIKEIIGQIHRLAAQKVFNGKASI